MLLVAGGWAAWALWQVDRSLDRSERASRFDLARTVLLPPELRLSDLATIGYDWEMFDLRAGKPFDGRSLRGKTLFVNLWDPGCVPCRAELPAIADLSERAELANVEFLSPVREGPNEVREFLAHSEVPVPGRVLIAGRAVPAAFAVDAIPTTLIVDREGRIVLREVGAADWNDPRVVDLLRRLSPSPPEAAAASGSS